MVLVDFVVFVAAGLVVVAIEQRDRHVVRLRTRPYCCCHHATQPACRALAHEALSLLPSCDATGMSCACARGLIIVAIVRHNRHVVRLRTRPYRRRHRATRPACRALAHEALSTSPSCDATGMSCACARGLIVVTIVRRDRHVVCLCTRPYRCCHRATRPACRALAHEALSSLPVLRCNWHVVRKRMRPYRCCPSGNAMYEASSLTFVVVIAVGVVVVAAMRQDVLSCACAQGLVAVTVARRNVLTARAHAHKGRW